MGGIASGAIYIASTLSAGGPATLEPPPAIAEPVRESAPRPYVIVDLPPAARGDTSVRGAIADLVRLDTAGELRADVPVVTAPVDVDAEVLASHAERIAVIRRHMDALREEGGSDIAPQLATLGAKLRRAEAARRLAAARVTLASGMAAERATRVVAAPPAAARIKPAVARIARVASAQPLSRPVTPAPPHRVRRPGESEWVIPAGSSDRLAFARAASVTPANAGPVDRRVAQVTLAGSGSSGRSKVDGPATPSLANARALLAKARVLLESDTPPASVRVAGLWEWEGSETWSLAGAPKRA